MRHRKKNNKLGRTSSHRKATLSNIAKAIFEHHQIKTTFTKAKASRSFVERLITYGKKDTVAARRLVFKAIQNHQLVKKIFDEIAPNYSERAGGYTRIIKLGRRKGDGAELAILQLVGFERLVIDEKKTPSKKKAKEKTSEEVKKIEAKAEEPVEDKSKEKKTETKAKAKTAEKEIKQEKKVTSKKKATKSSDKKKETKEETEKK
jgi:large subunit ribosomal protein L17